MWSARQRECTRRRRQSGASAMHMFPTADDALEIAHRSSVVSGGRFGICAALFAEPSGELRPAFDAERFWFVDQQLRFLKKSFCNCAGSSRDTARDAHTQKDRSLDRGLGLQQVRLLHRAALYPQRLRGRRQTGRLLGARRARGQPALDTAGVGSRSARDRW